MLLETIVAPFEPRDIRPAFRADVLHGLAAPQRTIPPRWFYDDEGCRLFDAITRLDEYYPTRAETALLEQHAGNIAATAGAIGTMLELGSGSSTKTPHLLRALAPRAYVPIDIAGDFMRESVAALAADFPEIDITPIEADFLHPLVLPEHLPGRKLVFFPGSTIGNFDPDTAVSLLRGMSDSLGDGALLLIGIDHLKESSVLVSAYDDADGVTARFNLNLLHRINRELAGDIPVANFRHRALWNERFSRIEMHLEATAETIFTIAGQTFTIPAGETIHTENSYKYGFRDARFLLRAAQWQPITEWTDPNHQFMMILAEAGAASHMP